MLDVEGQAQERNGLGNGPLAAALDALGGPCAIHSFEERSLSEGATAQAIAFVEISVDGIPGTVFGAGQSASITEASLRALISAVNRARTHTSG